MNDENMHQIVKHGDLAECFEYPGKPPPGIFNKRNR